MEFVKAFLNHVNPTIFCSVLLALLVFWGFQMAWAITVYIIKHILRLISTSLLICYAFTRNYIDPLVSSIVQEVIIILNGLWVAVPLGFISGCACIIKERQSKAK